MARFRFSRQVHAGQNGEEQADDLLLALARTRREWRSAHSTLNWAREPELIDFAVYRLQAAEVMYAYLIKQAKKKGHTTKEYVAIDVELCGMTESDGVAHNVDGR
ncbi:YaaL family protein [Numidum massiliense]|uniref:YaaL family protein n=1 Tax=Numidum massiliense TaxID=1522315 RepID=UPI0006D57FB1|nr:YaaL family protein [Numidum massiliense]